MTFELRDDLTPDDLPPVSGSRRPGSKYPLLQMKPGQHFVVEMVEGKTREQVRGPVQAAINRAQKHNPRLSFTVRYDRDHNVFRVFRLEDKEPGR
ncbi:hypothetical protein [Billgrantia desiderata]|uniref:hypothetical protein n=1 Tax=Billgrantia desiderata TaxID=52021 RepID=UPI001F15A8BD|nr:hypothetical protein [Halomonas desiderata]MCE8012863.1 hypothetical protein [Halomonas desiderata]